MGRHDPAKFRRELERRGAWGARSGPKRDRADEARPSRAVVRQAYTDFMPCHAQALRRELLLAQEAVEARCASKRRRPDDDAAPADAPAHAPGDAVAPDAQQQRVRGPAAPRGAPVPRQLRGFEDVCGGGKAAPRRNSRDD